MRFQILGPLEVLDDRGREVALGGPKQRAVLTILLLHAGEVLGTERLIDELWGETPPKSAANTLQVYVSNLRKAIGAGVLTSHHGGYRLERSEVELDVAAFEQPVAEARTALNSGDPGGAHRLLVRALSLWRGEPLTEFAYEAFAQGEIARLLEARTQAIELRIDALLAMGGDAGLVGELEGLIREHPLRERLRGQLMLALYRAGRQADALEAYQQARGRLVDELGIEPGEELRALQAAILTQDPSLAVTASASGGSDALDRGSLPRRVRPLVGRDRELRELGTLLSDPAVPLVTLTGTGGIGKTALALEAARQAREAFPDGVTVIWLASIENEQLVLGEFARAVNVTPAPDEPLLDALVRVLGGQERLLLVDNFEHLLGAATAVATLATEARRLKLLVTSRAPLRVSAERVLAVAPLEVPDEHTVALREAPAAALFIERAAGGDPSYSMSPADEDAIGELCRYLGGLPLALELAAARATVLSPGTILERLRLSFDTLGPAPRDAPARQRSLWATIEWSTNLIEPAERALFARLSAFSGGFTAEAAEALCRDVELNVTDGLTTLLDQGLIHRVPARQGTRLSMLAPIRAYARERLHGDPHQEAVLLAFAEYCATLAEEAGVGMTGPAQVHWIERIDDERANLRAVMHAAESPAELTSALRIVGALPEYWLTRAAALDDGWLAAVLDRYRDDPGTRARALYVLAVRTAQRGERQAAADAFSECLDLFDRVGNQRFALLTQARLSYVLHLLGAEEEAARLREHARVALQSEPDPLTRAQAQDWLVWRDTAEPDELRAAAAALLEAAEAAGNVVLVAAMNLSLGVHAMLAGDFPQARMKLERAMACAHPAWGDAIDPPIQANLGQVALYEGRTREARERLTEAARGAVRLGEPDKLQEVLIGLASAVACDGDEVRAGRLLAAARIVFEGHLSPEADAMQQRFLADVAPKPDDGGLRPGAPVGMRELEALLGEALKRSSSVS
jgi:predicted ATPase/DNA-binding SARP family transcriptional activator